VRLAYGEKIVKAPFRTRLDNLLAVCFTKNEPEDRGDAVQTGAADASRGHPLHHQSTTLLINVPESDLWYQKLWRLTIHEKG